MALRSNEQSKATKFCFCRFKLGFHAEEKEIKGMGERKIQQKRSLVLVTKLKRKK
jgi:hypothetical protein